MSKHTNSHTAPKEESGIASEKNADLKANLATRHLGIVAKRCFVFYRMLPPSVQNYYDIEDMISDVVMHIWTKREKYSAEKARESTWVQHITDNRCRSIISHFMTLKLNACETFELTDEISNHLSLPSQRELQDSMNAVERVIEFGSDSVLDFIAHLFYHAEICEVPVYEFMEAVKQAKATLHDFELVFHRAT